MFLQTRFNLAVKMPLKSFYRKHGRAVLEGVGQTGHTSVIGQAGVAVSWWKGWVEEGLLGGVVRLRLGLLGLGQSCGRGRRRGVATAKL